MKYLVNGQGAKEGVSQNKNCEDTPLQFYTRNKDGQYEMYPPITMYQRVLRFLKDLRASDFD